MKRTAQQERRFDIIATATGCLAIAAAAGFVILDQLIAGREASGLSILVVVFCVGVTCVPICSFLDARDRYRDRRIRLVRHVGMVKGPRP